MPVTTLMEVAGNPPSLPWLAHRLPEADCGLVEPNRREERVYRTGCYTVADASRDEVMWGVTQAVRTTGEWRILTESPIELEQGDSFVLQLWRNTLLPEWFLTVKYPLTGSARFVVELAYPKAD